MAIAHDDRPDASLKGERSADGVIAPAAIDGEAPWRWLAAGWADMAAMPGLSLAYGGAFVGIGALIGAGLWRLGLASMIPVAAGGFALAGPLMAVGLYEASRRRAAGETPRLAEVAFVKTAAPMQLAYMGFVIMFGLFVWARIALLIYAIFVSSTYLPVYDFSAFVFGTGAGLAMLFTGSVVGAVVAFGIFVLTAFSIPMLLDRETDVFTAAASSIAAVARNTGPMLLWAWLIGVFIAVGLATAFLGLVIVFPLIGYATWHGYREVFGDADA